MASLLDERTKILITAGLFRKIDLVFVFVFAVTVITVFFWRVFASPTAIQLGVVLASMILTSQFWMILVCFRVGEQVLRARADINMMPEAAARLAVIAQRGIGTQPAMQSNPPKR